MDMAQIGRLLVFLGLGTAALGALFWAVSLLPVDLRLGRLPGDIVIDQGGVKVFVPFATMLLLSALATLIVWLIGVLRR